MLRKRSVGYNRTDLPSLRRHYPGQVLRVLSQPSVFAESTPRNLKKTSLAKETAKIGTKKF